MKFSEKELRVIDIAETLFAEKGFEGTSVRDIAKEACGNVSIVSYHFGSKENLLIAIFERKTDEIKDHINYLLDNTELTDLQKMNIFIDEFLQNIAKNKNFHKILIREELFNRDPKIFEILHDFKKRSSMMFDKIYQHGIETGEFKKEADLKLLMSTIIGTVNQLYFAQNYISATGDTASVSCGIIDKDIIKRIGDYLKFIFKVMLTGKL
jgi:AcrR family transcriptional regulator